MPVSIQSPYRQPAADAVRRRAYARQANMHDDVAREPCPLFRRPLVPRFIVTVEVYVINVLTRHKWQ